MPEGKLERVGKIVGVIFTASIAVAQYLLLSRSPTKPVHFAVYLLGQAWLEFFIVIFGICAYGLGRILMKRYGPFAFRFSPRSLINALLKPAVLIPVAISMILALITVDHLYYLFRARQFFWMTNSRKAYARQYMQTIDVMSEVGRITDALNLTDTVLESLGTNSEAAYLSERQRVLKAAVARSQQLGQVEGGASWNPVSDRASYFRLIEALRVNPQNYEAAERLRSRLSAIDRWLPADLHTLCASNGSIANIRVHILSFQELQFRWAQVGGQSNCDSGAAAQGLRNAWLLEDGKCLLAVSEWTKTPFDFDHRATAQPKCSALAMKREVDPDARDSNAINLADAERRDNAWYEVNISETLVSIKRRLDIAFAGFRPSKVSGKAQIPSPNNDRFEPRVADQDTQIDSTAPIAFVRFGKRIELINVNGEFLDIPTNGNNRYSFPVVTGISPDEALSKRASRMKSYQYFISELDGSGEKVSEKMSEVDLSDPEDMKAIITDRSREIIVHFGHEDFLKRYEEYQAHLGEWLATYPKLSSVDMRYDRTVLEMQPDR
jgi:hypothetical protein